MERHRSARPRLLAGLVALLTLGLLWTGGTAVRVPETVPDALHHLLSSAPAGHEPSLLPARHGGGPGYGHPRGDRVDPASGRLSGTERAPHPSAVAGVAVLLALAAARVRARRRRPGLVLASLAGPGRRAPPAPAA